jgi:serine/threonine protein kinase
VYNFNENEEMLYALKELNKPIMVTKGALKVANNEVKILQKIPRNKFIMNICHAFQDETNAYVLMDFAP